MCKILQSICEAQRIELKFWLKEGFKLGPKELVIQCMGKGMKVTRQNGMYKVTECKCTNMLHQEKKTISCLITEPVIWEVLNLNSYWWIVDLENCVSFKYTAKWLSYIHTHIHIFILFSIIDYCKILNIVSCAIQ